MILSQYYIKKEISRQMKKQPERSSRKFCSLQKANRLLVFCSYSDLDVIDKQLSQLKSDNKDVILCVYSTTGDNSEKLSENDIIISPGKDLTKLGFPKQEKLDKCLSVGCDIIIDLTCGKVPALQYMLLKHNAPFKVGVKSNDMDLYDLTISTSEAAEIDYLFSQILFYLQTISFK